MKLEKTGGHRGNNRGKYNLVLSVRLCSIFVKFAFYAILKLSNLSQITVMIFLRHLKYDMNFLIGTQKIVRILEYLYFCPVSGLGWARSYYLKLSKAKLWVIPWRAKKQTKLSLFQDFTLWHIWSDENCKSSGPCSWYESISSRNNGSPRSALDCVFARQKRLSATHTFLQSTARFPARRGWAACHSLESVLQPEQFPLQLLVR